MIVDVTPRVSGLTISAVDREENPRDFPGGHMASDPRILLLMGIIVLVLAFIRDRKRGAFDPDDTLRVPNLPDASMNRRA
jgi:hypothetical protein